MSGAYPPGCTQVDHDRAFSHMSTREKCQQCFGLGEVSEVSCPKCKSKHVEVLRSAIETVAGWTDAQCLACNFRGDFEEDFVGSIDCPACGGDGYEKPFTRADQADAAREEDQDVAF